jgi:Cof subfamily protein (haloacid dehalogenase superfamily)
VSSGSGGAPIELFVVDVDGTLLTPEKELTERSQRAVHRLRERGVRVALTSGRPPRGMRMLIEPLGLRTPLAGFNGGMYVDPELRILEERFIDPDAAREVADLLDRLGLDVWVYRKNDWYVRDPDAPHVAREHRTVAFEPLVTSDLGAKLDAAVKIVGVSDDPERMAGAEEEVRGLDGRVRAVRSQPYYLDVTHPEATKGAVVRFLADRLGVAPERIATIGDMPTDLSMFEAAGLSIAMGNADPEVRARALLVAPSNREEGFARAAEEMILPRAPGSGGGPGGSSRGS